VVGKQILVPGFENFDPVFLNTWSGFSIPVATSLYVKDAMSISDKDNKSEMESNPLPIVH